MVGDNYLSREEIHVISHHTQSVPVWIIWGPKPVLRLKEFDAFFPSPERIEEMKQHSNKGKSVDNGWDDWGENIVVDDEIAVPSGSSQAPPSTANVSKRKMVNGQYVGETRDEFFEWRVIRCQAKIAAQSSRQRQSREACKNNHAKHQVCPFDRKSWTSMCKWVDNVIGERSRYENG